MPRIRNWKDLKFFKADRDLRYEHIDSIFTEVIDWQLIETHLFDMLKVVLSIQVGKTVLKRLASYSRKNRLYLAFRELGRVVRTVFLMRYAANEDLQRSILIATNKSEQFNGFLDWVSFGADVISSNNRDEQRKRIKYQHLVANCLIFYTVMSLTGSIKQLRERGVDVPEDMLMRINPYLTEHINRFGEYRLDLSRQPAEPIYDYRPGD